MSTIVKLMFTDTSTYSQGEQECSLSRLHTTECLRYARFSNPRRRHTWLVGRTFLLDVLQRELSNFNAESIRTDEYGGIHLLDEPIRLSLSHSQNMFVVSLSGYTTGVDIEYVRPRKLLQQVGQVFTRSETNRISDLQEAERLDAFYRYWTLKEAACKAAGISIWEGLRSTCFDLRIGGFDSHAPFPEGDWHFMTATIGPKWRVAFAGRDMHQVPKIDCWQRTAAWQWRRHVLEHQMFLCGR